MTAAKNEGRRARQTVGVLPYFFPSLAASSFDLEAPLTLEETREQLHKLAHVRRGAPYDEPFYSTVIGALALNQNRAMSEFPQHSANTVISPFEVQAVLVDDDTYRYQIALDENRVRVVVRGYLKRWEAASTVVNGKVRFDVHYLGLIFKSMIYTIGVGATLAAATILAYVLSWFVPLPQIFYSTVQTLQQPDSLKIVMVLVWLLVLAVVWFNDVVLRSQLSRQHLMTRIEDMMLFPLS